MCIRDRFKHGALHLGTIGDPFTDDAGKTRPFTLADARGKRDAARELVSKGIDPREAQRLAEAEAVEAQRLRLAALDGRRTVKEAFERWHELYLTAHRKDGGEFVKAMFEGTSVGDPLQEGMHIGPVVNKAQYEKIQGLIQSAIDEGATLETGGTCLLYTSPSPRD